MKQGLPRPYLVEWKLTLPAIAGLVALLTLVIAMTGSPSRWNTSFPPLVERTSESQTAPQPEIAVAAIDAAQLRGTTTADMGTGAKSAAVDTMEISQSESNTMTMGGQQLSGQLIMIDHSLFPEHKVVLFDLESEETTTLFDVPEQGWIYQLDASPEGTQIAMAYAAPPGNKGSKDKAAVKGLADTVRADEAQPYDRSGIYLLSLEEPNAEPQYLFGAQAAGSYFFNPVWSTDAQSIYYISYRRLDVENSAGAQQPTLDVALYRYDIATGKNQFIAHNATWPRPAPDGKSVVYIQVDPITKERGIRVATEDGGQIAEVVAMNQFFDVDSPLFSPDGEWIYFSAVPHSTKVSGSRSLGYGTSPRLILDTLVSGDMSSDSWWEALLDVKVARAHTDHNVPADWWRVPATGGEAEKVTAMRRIVSYGEFTTGGRQLLSATSTGIYVINGDGAVAKRLPLPNLYRFVVWTARRAHSHD